MKSTKVNTIAACPQCKTPCTRTESFLDSGCSFITYAPITAPKPASVNNTERDLEDSRMRKGIAP